MLSTPGKSGRLQILEGIFRSPRLEYEIFRIIAEVCHFFSRLEFVLSYCNVNTERFLVNGSGMP